MRITITVEEVLDRCLWDKVCALKGINIWAVNEGMMELTEEIQLTPLEAEELGLTNRKEL